MKKELIAAVAILVLLVGACSDKDKKKTEKTKQNPFSILAANTTRLEITKPDGEKRVLEKQEGKWRILEPIQAQVSDFHSEKMNTIFGGDILMDQDILPKDKLSDYDLSKERAYKVSLFTKDSEKANTIFYVGKEGSTKAGERRSYIKNMKGVPYRAKSEISAVVRAPISNLRSKLIFEGKGKPTSISIVPRKGQEIKFELIENTWAMTSPKKENFKMDSVQVRQLVDAFTKIRANGFGDGKTDKEMDLDPPRSIVTAKVGEETIQYEIGNPAKKIYFIRIKNEKQAYKVTKGPGRVLAGDYLIFKDRVEKAIAMDEIISFELAGPSKLKVKRRGQKWFAGKTELDATKVAPLLGTFSKMRAVKWKHETIEEAGLKPPAGQVIMKTKTKTHAFAIGKTFKEDKSRYARWSNSEYVMEIPYFIWDRATTELETLKIKEKK